MAEGEKMSKSKGNVITLSNALDNYGADVIRSALMDGAEGLDDMDWREKNARDIQGKINALPGYLSSLVSSRINDYLGSDTRKTSIDLWLENQIQKRIRGISTSLDSMKTKSAFQEAFYSFWNVSALLRITVRQPETRSGNLRCWSLAQTSRPICALFGRGD